MDYSVSLWTEISKLKSCEGLSTTINKPLEAHNRAFREVMTVKASGSK